MSTTTGNENLRIMVIDDSSTIRRSAEIFLGFGYKVVLAEDGFDALAKINDTHPHLIFLRHFDAALGWISNVRAHQRVRNSVTRR